VFCPQHWLNMALAGALDVFLRAPALVRTLLCCACARRVVVVGSLVQQGARAVALVQQGACRRPTRCSCLLARAIALTCPAAAAPSGDGSPTQPQMCVAGGLGRGRAGAGRGGAGLRVLPEPWLVRVGCDLRVTRTAAARAPRADLVRLAAAARGPPVPG
jgi:hypothetical protein